MNTSAIYSNRIRLVVTLALAFLIVVANLAPVSGLTSEQKKVIGSGIPYFNVEQTPSTCNVASTLTGSEITEKVYNFLIGKGLTPPQAAGIMGNLQEESGINPRRVQGAGVIESDTMKLDGKTGYGLAQWTSLGRQQGLHAAAVAAGVQDSDLTVQLDYLYKEMEGPEFSGNGFAQLKASNDYREVTSIFMLKFERPKDQSQSAQDKRAAHSLAWLTKYGSTTPVTSPTGNTGPPVVGTCVGGSANSTTGGYSLPVSEEFYLKNIGNFSEDHHLNYTTGAQSPGSDIRMPVGTLIYSMSSGTIKKAPNGTVDRETGGYGLGVTVDAGNGVEFIYGHGIDGGAFPGAKQGDTVKAGQPIMHSGNTGSSTGPHLHISIVVDGQQRCPQTFFAGIYNKSIPDVRSLPALGCSSKSAN